MAKCNVCFRKCEIQEGGIGFCGVRSCKDGKVTCENYGKVTSLALDPIEKKPLSRFHPGSMILSVGSFGCNLRCPFCQNHSISWGPEVQAYVQRAEFVAPEALVDTALKLRTRGNIGLAFTYNEPLIGYEYVRDTARISHEKGMVNAMVTNGTASHEVLNELLPYIDAMNIDLKGFTDSYYKDVLGGDRQMVLDFIREATKGCHVELTTLIIPGENDSEEEMVELSNWIAGIDPSIPLHVSRFFPQFRMTDRPATDVALIYKLAALARKKLNYVYTGNC